MGNGEWGIGNRGLGIVGNCVKSGYTVITKPEKLSRCGWDCFATLHPARNQTRDLSKFNHA